MSSGTDSDEAFAQSVATTLLFAALSEANLQVAEHTLQRLRDFLPQATPGARVHLRRLESEWSRLIETARKQ